MMRQPVLLLVLLVPACSISNAFLGFPDFQVTPNNIACSDFHIALDEERRRCSQEDGASDLGAVCPETLNERDSLCASVFRCQQESIVCTNGSVEFDFSCSEQIGGVICTDPLDDIVELTLQVQIEGFETCADAGVATFAALLQATGAGTGEILGELPCLQAGDIGGYRFTTSRRSLPADLLIIANDQAGTVTFGSDRIDITEEDIVLFPDTNFSQVDLGTVTLRPPP